MNVVDSSAWLEYFADASNAQVFTPFILDSQALIVPTIVVYETFKRLLQQRGEEVAMEGLLAIYQGGYVVDLDAGIAVEAARLSVSLRLPIAYAIILATARRFGATVWTQDAHFEGLPDTRVFPK